MRINCTVVGEIDFERQLEVSRIRTMNITENKPFNKVNKTVGGKIDTKKDHEDPVVVRHNGRLEWILSEDDIGYIALGACLLAAGGGGSQLQLKYQTHRLISNNTKIRIISTESMIDTDLSVMVACFGAPAPLNERLAASEKYRKVFEFLSEELKKENKTITSLISVEIGGLNSLTPLYVGGVLNLPVIDGDYMGRAFPKLYMTTPFWYGGRITPLIMVGDYGEPLTLTTYPKDYEDGEIILRNKAISCGLDTAITGMPATREQLKKFLIMASMSRCYFLGRALSKAKEDKVSPLKYIEENEGGKLIFTGKIMDTHTTNEKGYTFSYIKIIGLEKFKGFNLFVRAQNEMVVAYKYPENISEFNEYTKEKYMIAVVPDIITLVNSDTYEPILVEEVKYGLKVTILAIPCDELLSTDIALGFCGPKAFGVDVSNPKQFLLKKPQKRTKSVFEEYKPKE